MTEDQPDEGDTGTVLRNVHSGTATYVVQAGTVFGGVHVNTAPPVGAAERALAELAAVVHAQWREEAGTRGLSGPGKLAVPWVSDVSPSDDADPSGAVDRGLPELVTALRGVAERRLVALGGAGAGKTSFVILLVLELLRSWDGVEPLPVVLSAASWDPTREHFDTWVARSVHEEYGGLRRGLVRGTIDALVRDRRLLPVVDGLDEMPRPMRVRALRALGSALTDGAPLVLTSRIDEFTEAVAQGGTVPGAMVITARPVSGEAAAKYLRATSRPQGKERWAPVLEALTDGSGGPVREALTAPLMLWLARTVYAEPDTDPTELTDRTRFRDTEALRRHLLDSLVPAVFPAGPRSPYAVGPVRDWDSRRAKRWLGFLAVHATRLRSGDVEWWRLHRAVLPTALLAPALYLLYLCYVALVDLVIVVLHDQRYPPRMASVYDPDPMPPWMPLVWASRTAVVSGFVAVVLTQIVRLGRADVPRSLSWPGRRGTRTTRRGVLTAVIAVVPVVGMVPEEPVIGTSLLACCVVVFLVTSPVDMAKAVGPRALLRGERRTTLVTALVVGLTAGGITAMVTRRSWDWAPRMGTMSENDLELAVLGTLITGGIGAAAAAVALLPWGRWVLARTALAATGRLPWSVMTFLGDAHRVGLLRQVGGAYQFRHALLQARLAENYRARRHVAEPTGLPVERVRFVGGLGVWSRRGRAARYLPVWSVLVVWASVFELVAPLSFESEWLVPAVFLLAAVPLAVDFGYLPFARRRAELRLDGHGVAFTRHGRTQSFAWSDIAEVVVRAPGPGRRAEPELWARLRTGDDAGVPLLPLSPLSEDEVVPDELDRALARFAGDRWSGHPAPAREMKA